MILELPMPPSVNGMYRNVPGKGRVKTSAYLTWAKEAAVMVMIQLKPPRQPLTGDVKVIVEMQKPKVRSDIDNRAKALLDLFTSSRVWNDDSQVVDLRLRWADVRGCRVTLEAA